MKKVILLFIVIFIIAFNLKINAQWTEQTSGVTTALYSVFAVDDDVVWICGAGGKVLRTTNGGVNWITTNSPNASLNLYCIYGINSYTALVTGSSSTAYVYKTSNGGQNWTQTFFQTGGFINVIMHDQISPYVIAGNPVNGYWTFFQSVDEGSTWDTLSTLPQADSETGFNNAGLIFEDNYVSIGTNNTRIYHSFQAQNWTIQPTIGYQNIYAINFVDDNTGVAGSSTGLLVTTNRGTDWLPLFSPGSGNINGIVFGHNIGEVYYTRGSSVYYSANSGTNWVAVTTQTGTYQHMNRARSGTRNNFWAIRNNGGISKYTKPIGINVLSTEIPSAFSLSQNYPNPFNPTTKIRFDVPIDSRLRGNDNVVLKIYDALGREVAVLVNEQLRPGTYEADWNASNYPSGVYFYRLRTDGFTETKKMILIK